jgi:4-amino-4-deoxy-L-arabinose transferase-like glycosyltransferase
MPVRIRNFERGIELCWWFLLAVVIATVVWIRIHFLAIPLERDEGEYAYAGQLMLQGIPPYQLAYNMKFPGVYAAYALIMAIFGQTSVAIHLGLLLVNLATIVIVFLIARRLINSIAGIAAAASYAILSVSSSVLGLAAHATHFVMLPVLGGILLLLDHPRSDGLPARRSLGAGGGSRRTKYDGWKAVTPCFVSGLLFGIGLLMKQPAIFFICFGAVYLLFRDWNTGLDFKQMLLRTAVFIAASALPLACVFLWLWQAGVFPKFWFWTVTYAREYASAIPISKAPRIFLGETIDVVIGSGWPLWTLAALGVVAGPFDKAKRNATFFILTFLVFSGLALSSGFWFRQHYFIFVLPAICLLVGIAVASASNFCSQLARPLRFLPIVIFVVCSSVALFAGQKALLSRSPSDAVRLIYGPNPFPEAVRIAEYLREHTNPADTIAVVGSEPESYFYAHRHSATGYMYTDGLMESQRYAGQQQREMIREIEAARPKYLVFVVVPQSWLTKPNSETEIFDWIDRYTSASFRLEGIVNIISRDRTDYYLPLTIDPKSIQLSKYYLLIFKRKT